MTRHGLIAAALFSFLLVGFARPATAAITTTTLVIPGELTFILENENDSNDQVRLYIGNRIRNEPIDVTVEYDSLAGTLQVTGSGDGHLYPIDAYLTGDPPIDPLQVISGSFDITWTGLSFGTDPSTGQDVLAIGRMPAAATGTLDLAGSDIQGGSVTLQLFDKYLDLNNPAHATWGAFTQDPFNLFAGIVPGGGVGAGIYSLDTGETLSAWLMSSEVTIGGTTYLLTRGDVHGRIPEPSSLALVALLMGVPLNRRRRCSR